MKTITKMRTSEGSTTIEFLQDAAREYRWRVTSRNGEIIGASSEGFSSMQACKRNLSLLVLCVNEIAIEGWHSV